GRTRGPEVSVDGPARDPTNDDRPESAEPQASTLVAGDACPYCGARLVRAYYFCVACATPWADEESVLPPLRPAVPTVGELIDRRAPAVKPLFWTYFAVVLGGGILVFLTFGQERIGAAYVTMDALILVVTAAFAVRYGGTLRPAFARLGF